MEGDRKGGGVIEGGDRECQGVGYNVIEMVRGRKEGVEGGVRGWIERRGRVSGLKKEGVRGERGIKVRGRGVERNGGIEWEG